MKFYSDPQTPDVCRAYAKAGRVVVFDTETTGLSSDDEIVQIAAVEYAGGNFARAMSVFICPTCAVRPEAEEVHRLSRRFLDAHGIEPTVALDRFFSFLGDNALLVGHNIYFDLRMLRNECRKFSYCADVDGIPFCDTIALAKRLVPGLPSYSLGALAEALPLDGTNPHDALSDAHTCGALFFELMRHFDGA